MLTISKDKSRVIKGIVIIMMVFMHLFNGNHTDLCSNLIFVGDVPFTKWLSNACNPVDFFLLLSGYGLAYTYEHKGLFIVQQIKRIFKLYVHYWLILLLFVFLGVLIKPEAYPGSWNLFLLNLSGWFNTYNGELWFLLPYCMVSLVSPWLISFAKRHRMLAILLLMGLIHVMTCFVISRYGAEYLYNDMLLYRPLQFFHFLYAFSVGVVFYQTRFKLDKVMPSWAAVILASLIVVLVSSFGNAVIYMVYVPLMIFLFCQMSYPKWIELFLMELGRKSMPIWMIHTWYCYYLFQPQIYSLKYPIAILGGTLLVSYLTAIPVMWTAKKLFLVIKM